MNYLLDTHIFLWWLNDDKRLEKSTREILEDPSHIIYASVVSAWEISIKLKKYRRFRIRASLEHCFKLSGFEILPIELRHVLQLHKLPSYHRDPFDRMLIAQAISERLILISDDQKIKQYKVKIFP